eukprot:CAMPEP_0172624338 /NCGR_PEP_ID=MMETSP1068-20121228/135652_1 /TAXON_ID=35684 /ORGANISM="Pseudopedinella elastica, Strain CCMP716" /LENGTH=44 /DNA_ID= /DNA_START= /DNA_END= /DNA_ORIENTATION=
MSSSKEELLDLPEAGQAQLLFLAAAEGRADVIQRIIKANEKLRD